MPATSTLRTITLTDDRPPLIEPVMSNSDDAHERLRVTSRWIEVDGTPTVPVTGELHFSRVPRRRWEEELRLLVASGLTSVSTYVFWIHHERERGRVRFDGDLDVAAFLETAERVGIDVILRIGPWCHGEARHGGHPDWVVAALGDRARTNDAEYLDLVREWYRRIADEVRRFCGPDRPIVGIQLENELHDQPDHIATLKFLAQEAGLSAPLWTATAWGGAVLPAHEVFPLYSGYADGFWAGQGSTWDDSFRDHFRFTHVWDDPGVGGDFRDEGAEIVIRPIDPEFPPSTCELGGGMATAYHRRPIARGRDIAALANVKIGNGSAWQGFYMYAGGVNPEDGLQESLATGYPNDLPRFDYDFQAAVGATGRPGPSLGVLRDHNAFLAAFGPFLADTFSSLPDGAPVDVHDLDSLRWAVRSDGARGFLFLNTHQPHEPLPGSTGVQFRIPLADGDLLVPDRPIDIPSGVIARWPLRIDVAGVRLEWATASASGIATGSGDEPPTLVLRAHDGIPARVQLGAGSRVLLRGQERNADAPLDLSPGDVIVVDDALRILVVDDEGAERLWYLGGDLIDSTDAVWRESGRVVVRAEREPSPLVWRGGEFVPLATRTDAEPGSTTPLVAELRPAGEPPARYGESMGRSAAPDSAQFDEVAGVWRITPIPRAERKAGDLVELVIDWEGDVAQLRADGVVINDRFWDGSTWRIDVTELPVDADLTLHIAPIAAHSVIDLDAAVRARVETEGWLGSVTRVDVVVSSRWVAEC
ncbi:beta-galactosidase [Microbacterium sp. C5A9]|uniref:beta-galactosidase n=1 Tax=Microbacterium sp. C5A9 TaxID=2736663 RepID=UPI001F51D0A2|nr:beta-galactosidase [Microbacterium sp. C5A9]MCI1018987.1 beta-galactosidase [Microbacterium sp. C5A9]